MPVWTETSHLQTELEAWTSSGRKNHFRLFSLIFSFRFMCTPHSWLCPIQKSLSLSKVLIDAWGHTQVWSSVRRLCIVLFSCLLQYNKNNPRGAKRCTGLQMSHFNSLLYSIRESLCGISGLWYLPIPYVCSANKSSAPSRRFFHRKGNEN